MIAVFVCEQDTVDLQRIYTTQCKALLDLQTAQPAVEQQTRLRRLHKRAIARTSAAEDGEMKHRLSLLPHDRRVSSARCGTFARRTASFSKKNAVRSN